MTETQIKSLKKKFPELCEKCKVISENGKKILRSCQNRKHDPQNRQGFQFRQVCEGLKKPLTKRNKGSRFTECQKLQNIEVFSFLFFRPILTKEYMFMF